MRDYDITYKEYRGAELTPWAIRSGSRKDVEETAARLLAGLREDNRGATVYIDGHRYTPEKEKQL